MFTRPNILVASDFSETSDFALKAAEKLRQKSLGKIQAIHVTPYPQQWDWLTNDVVINYYPGEYKEELMRSLKERLDEQLQKCGVEGESEVLMGPPGNTILDYAANTLPDLIVVGHKGHGSFFHLGDVAAKVVNGTDRPVLVINKSLDAEKIAGLVDPFQPEKTVFSTAEEVGFLCSADVEFVSLWPDTSVYVEEAFPEAGYSVVKMTEDKKKEVKLRMENILKSQIDPHSKAHIRTEVSEDLRIRDGLIRLLDSEDVDLAVMTRHHKGKIERFLLGSVTRGLLDHWKGNLMILPS